MKMRRFNAAGIARVRQVLKEIEKDGNLTAASELVTRDDLAEQIPSLSTVELDPDRIFPTTFAFCEYFHSLLKDHKPLAYRTDVGFWTWLAMVYVRQLVKIDSETNAVDVGDEARTIYSASVFGKSHRHLLASSYYLYSCYAGQLSLVQVPLLHELNSPGDIFESIIARQTISQNPAFLNAVRILYFDEENNRVKSRVAGPDQPGGIRRFVDMVDQFGMTRDFREMDDAYEFIALLPNEFTPFKL